MPSPSKARLTISYFHDGEHKDVTVEVDPCKISYDRDVVETAPRNGYRCYKTTDLVTIILKGLQVKDCDALA